MVQNSTLLEVLQELASFQPANDERGIAFSNGSDLQALEFGEILEQISFLRNWAGAIQIMSLAEPRPSAARLDNPILRTRLEALEDELRHRRRERAAA